MKKSLLFGAAALMAFAANAQSLTKVWEISMADHTTVETRSIGCIGDKALVPNNAAQELEVWGANGMESSYKIGEWLTTNDIKLNPEDAAPLVMGRGVSVDEAGNIIQQAADAVTLNYGNFLQVTFDFLIIAFSVFLFIRLIGKLSRKKEEEKPAPAPAPEPSAEEKLLTEIRDLLKEQKK